MVREWLERVVRKRRGNRDDAPRFGASGCVARFVRPVRFAGVEGPAFLLSPNRWSPSSRRTVVTDKPRPSAYASPLWGYTPCESGSYAPELRFLPSSWSPD